MMRHTLLLAALAAPMLAGCVEAEQGYNHDNQDPVALHSGGGNWIFRETTLNVVSSSQPGPGGILIHTADWTDNQNCVYVHGLRLAHISEVFMEAEPEVGDVVTGEWLVRASIVGQLDDYRARGPLPVTLETPISGDVAGTGAYLDDRILLEVIPVADGPASADGTLIAATIGIKAARTDWVEFEFPETCPG